MLQTRMILMSPDLPRFTCEGLARETTGLQYNLPLTLLKCPHNPSRHKRQITPQDAIIHPQTTPTLN